MISLSPLPTPIRSNLSSTNSTTCSFSLLKNQRKVKQKFTKNHVVRFILTSMSPVLKCGFHFTGEKLLHYGRDCAHLPLCVMVMSLNWTYEGLVRAITVLFSPYGISPFVSRKLFPWSLLPFLSLIIFLFVFHRDSWFLHRGLY